MGRIYNAANMGSEQTVTDLLSQGVDVDETGMNGATPLHLTAGLDQYVVGEKGKPPPNNTAVAKLLIERGADVGARSPVAGRRPLHGFAEHDNIEVAALLLERGADVNAPDVDGRTPLHMAARWGNARMVKLLLDHGADVDAEVADGTTPLRLAEMNKHDEVVRLLQGTT